MDRNAVINILRKRKEKLGTWSAVANDLGIGKAYLSDCINGRREMGKGILEPLGIQAHTVYVYVKVK